MRFGGRVDSRGTCGRSPGRAGAAGAVVAALLLASCTTAGQPTAVPLDERPGSMGAYVSLAALSAAPKDVCPLTTIATAVHAAGLTAGGAATGSVEVLNPDLRMDGVAADCSIKISGGGSVSVLLIAARTGTAVLASLPRLQQDADLRIASLRTIADVAAGQQPGDLVGIPGSKPVALRIASVDGASTAALLVTGDAGPSRGQVEAVAGALAHR